MLTRNTLYLNPQRQHARADRQPPLIATCLVWAVRAFCITLSAHGLVAGISGCATTAEVMPFTSEAGPHSRSADTVTMNRGDIIEQVARA